MVTITLNSDTIMILCINAGLEVQYLVDIVFGDDAIE